MVHLHVPGYRANGNPCIATSHVNLRISGRMWCLHPLNLNASPNGVLIGTVDECDNVCVGDNMVLTAVVPCSL